MPRTAIAGQRWSWTDDIPPHPARCPDGEAPRLQRSCRWAGAADRDLQAILGGELNITASSILQDVVYNTDYTSSHCNSNPYDCGGKPLTAFAGGTITLKQSYVSLINAQDPKLIPAGVLSYANALFGPANAGFLVAGDSVWLQTTPNQSAADLQSLFGIATLLTSGIPLSLMATAARKPKGYEVDLARPMSSPSRSPKPKRWSRRPAQRLRALMSFGNPFSLAHYDTRQRQVSSSAAQAHPHAIDCIGPRTTHRPRHRRSRSHCPRRLRRGPLPPVPGRS